MHENSVAERNKGNVEGAEELVKRLCGRKKVPKIPILQEEGNKRLEIIKGKESW